MGVYRFEDLRVWQAAKEQCDRVGLLMKRPEFRQDPALLTQMNEASLSVMLNISEGFLRRRDKETLQFLRFSKVRMVNFAPVTTPPMADNTLTIRNAMICSS